MIVSPPAAPAPTGAAALTALQACADALLADLRAGAVAGLPPLPALRPVLLRLSGRLTRAAGIYYPDRAEITISSHALAAHGVAGLDGVVRHEVAHHVVRALHGRQATPHGREFHAVARALRADLRAEAFAAPRTVYIYRCPVCGWEWQRGRRIQRGQRFGCCRCAPRYEERFRLRFIARRREMPSLE